MSEVGFAHRPYGSPMWGRSTVDRRLWYVMDDFWGNGYAVADDFGNLVKVPK